jgi:hypothetical protein
VTLDLETGQRHVAVATPAPDEMPRFSPNGRWLAYTSLESGRSEVYAVPLPGLRNKWQISTDGGREPRWSRSGEEILFRSLGGEVLKAGVALDGEPEFGTPVAQPGLRTLNHFGYDVDGRGWLLALAEQRRARSGLGLVQGWPRLLDGASPP